MAINVPLPHGPLPGWAWIALGVMNVLIGTVFLPGGRPGFATASGQVVEHRLGKRPTVVEFSPSGASPVRFRHGRRLAIGTTVEVSYSVADPSNARVGREKSTRSFGVMWVVVGVLFILLGIL